MENFVHVYKIQKGKKTVLLEGGIHLYIPLGAQQGAQCI